MTTKKLFVVSDVHGHDALLRAALHRAGFDPENETHIFVSCGDLFDRGPGSRRVYDFVRSLPRKVLIRGNHEDLLVEALERGSLEWRDYRNATAETIAEFLGNDAIAGSGKIDCAGHAEKVRELLDFVSGTVNYLETEAYVFTHGWLPITDDPRHPKIRPDWRSAPPEAWHKARWLEWQQLYNVRAMLDGKTIVCGHRTASLGRQFDPMREPDCYDPFYGDGLIAIDALTVRSGVLHALVFEIGDL